MRLTGIAGFENFSFLHLPPTGKMQEGFEFYTDIVTSQDGSESRSVGRTVARHTLSYSVSANLFNRQFPFNLGEQNIRGNWAIPIWSDVQKMSPLNANATIPVDPYLSDFRAGSLVMAFVNNDDWQIRKIISALSTGSITITGGTIGSGPSDLASAVYNSVSFSTSQETVIRALTFSSDGTKMYVVGEVNDTVYQHTLSTAWNIGTASYSGVSVSVRAQEGFPEGLAFSSDGTKMYVVGLQNQTVYQYTLSTAWNIGTASYSGVSVGVPGGQTSGLIFKPDGTKMYYTSLNSKDVRQFSLSTAWDLSTAADDSISFYDFSISGNNQPFGLSFKSDGTKLYISWSGTNDLREIRQYNLSTAWNLGTASYNGVPFMLGFSPNDVFFKPDGGRMYITKKDENDPDIYQYDLVPQDNAIQNLTIGGVPVISSPVLHTGNNTTTATNLASAINSFVSSPDYSATSSGAVITITASAVGPDAVIAATLSGNVTVGSFVNISGGNGVGANSITLESPFNARPFAYIVPVNAARLRGDIDFEVGGFSSDFNFNADIIAPKQYPTKLGVLFACDVSTTMSGTKLTALKADLTRVLQDLKGTVVNSGVRIDLCLCFWGASENTLTYLDATSADIDTAISAVAGIGLLGSPNPLLAFNRAITFFGNSSPNPNDRKDIMFFSTDSTTSLTTSRAAALDLITRASPYNGRKSVDIYAIGIELSSFSELSKVDNTSNGAYSNVNSATPFAMSDRFLSALSPIIGYQFDGYEILTKEPDSNNKFSRTITQREDIFDNELASYATRSPWAQSRVKSNHPFLFEGGEDSVAIKQFLYRRQGAARLFYMPTFQHDLPAYAISENLTQINVPKLDIRSFDANRVDVAIQFVDGTWQGNRITSITADIFGGWLITFSRALRRGLAEVRQISYMGLSRFETDRIEMQWVGNRAITMSINMLEIDK